VGSTSLILIIASLATFAVITGISTFHFTRKGAVPLGAIVISAAAVSSVAVFAWCAWTAPRDTLLALPLYAAALGLFLWTIRTTRRRDFVLAFTKIVPASLSVDGPYAYVRHPFYVSYLIYHFTNALATTSLLPWAMFALMVVIYVVAARGEEQFLSQGDYGNEYGAYRRRTGMFIPKLW
jgi:protein-S-isoprenylcysteine O-methyltransferase Ste14